MSCPHSYQLLFWSSSGSLGFYLFASWSTVVSFANQINLCGPSSVLDPCCWFGGNTMAYMGMLSQENFLRELPLLKITGKKMQWLSLKILKFLFDWKFLKIIKLNWPCEMSLLNIVILRILNFIKLFLSGAFWDSIMGYRILNSSNVPNKISCLQINMHGLIQIPFWKHANQLK